jgi:hypothetical protein
MKKQIGIGIVLLLLVVGLSGCNETLNYIDEDLIEISDMSVVTKYRSREEIEGSYQEVAIIKDGFYHDVKPSPLEIWDLRYEISGTVKNVAGRKLDKIIVSAKLYDVNGNFLGDSGDFIEGVYNLPNTYSDNFLIIIFAPDQGIKSSFEYFYNVEDYELIVKES